jgi:hypothetical protein
VYFCKLHVAIPAREHSIIMAPQNIQGEKESACAFSTDAC